MGPLTLRGNLLRKAGWAGQGGFALASDPKDTSRVGGASHTPTRHLKQLAQHVVLCPPILNPDP